MESGDYFQNLSEIGAYIRHYIHSFCTHYDIEQTVLYKSQIIAMLCCVPTHEVSHKTRHRKMEVQIETLSVTEKAKQIAYRELAETDREVCLCGRARTVRHITVPHPTCQP